MELWERLKLAHAKAVSRKKAKEERKRGRRNNDDPRKRKLKKRKAVKLFPKTRKDKVDKRTLKNLDERVELVNDRAYPPYMLTFQTKQLNSPTPPEVDFDNMLRRISGDFYGLTYEKQRIVHLRVNGITKYYLLDFFATSGGNIAFEVDGKIHLQNRAYDKLRDRRLGAVGINVVRIPARWVLMKKNVHAATDVICNALRPTHLARSATE